MALIDFCYADQDRIATFYAAYLDSGGPGRLVRREDFTMVIAQFGHFWEKDVRTYLAPGASDATKAHCLARIDEAASSPLRLEHIDAVLDWARSRN